MQTIDPSIRHLIFDLGGVIINLAPTNTVNAFATLSGLSADDVFKLYTQQPVFHDYEKGLLTDAEFRVALRTYFAADATDDQLDACWNAMLLDIPIERIQLLKRLRSKYSLFLLSNTNNIHLQCFNGTVHNLTQQPSLDSLFDRAYYSHEMKMRKPDTEIYEYVLKQHNLAPHETLFLDDNLSNLEGAQKVGIKTFHVQHPDLIFTLFNESKA
ncbi:MAG: HAD family hydrolase [Bacteroidota bacterium]